MTAGPARRGGVIFDVDGTLLDTNYLHVAAWWEAFRERGRDIRCADVHRALGMGSAELVEQVLGHLDPSVIDAHSRHFAPYLGRMRPLPGAPDLLAATARLGLHVVLATSAKDDEVELMLDAIGARDAIGTVVSSGAVERAKPHPDIVKRALSESGTDRTRAVMVGDAVWDMIAARRAGIPGIGLLSGGIAAEQLRDAGAVEVYDDAAALLGRLHASAIGQLVSGQPAMLALRAEAGWSRRRTAGGADRRYRAAGRRRGSDARAGPAASRAARGGRGRAHRRLPGDPVAEGPPGRHWVAGQSWPGSASRRATRARCGSMVAAGSSAEATPA